ncbi:MAG TPA: MFS transporter [Anaerolineales bacterium]|nr:MFS transporter [Anaerolineales bacterium]
MSNTSHKPLPFINRLAFGMGDLGTAMVSMIKGFLLLGFLIKIAGLSAFQAGWVLLLTKIWDAVNDPFVGTLTDRTRTPWGRRRPWLLFGSIAFAIAFILSFYAPNLANDGFWSARFWYYVLVGVLLDAAFTAVNVPYAALTPELSSDAKERNTLNMFRFIFSVLGGLVAILIFQAVIGAFQPDERTGNFIAAIVVGAIVLFSGVFAFAFTREKDFSQESEQTLGYIEGLRLAFANRAFVITTLIYLFSWLAIQFVQSALQLYFADWLGADGGTFFITVALLQTCIAVGVIVWSIVGNRIGQKRVYYIGMAFWIVVQISLFFVQPGQITLAMGLAVLAAIGVAVGFIVPWNLLPAVVDYDELQTGQRREGVYYGFFVFLQKLGISLGLWVQGLVLGWAGYISVEYGQPAPDSQPASALLALRLMISFAPILMLILGILAVRAYPISPERHAEILDEIAKRKQSKHAA